MVFNVIGFDSATFGSVAQWIGVVWPMLIFCGTAVWLNGRQRGAEGELSTRLGQMEQAARTLAAKAERLDLRLTTSENELGHQSRQLDRMETKLDHLMAGSPPRPSPQTK